MNESVKNQRLKEMRLRAYVCLEEGKRHVSTMTGKKKLAWVKTEERLKTPPCAAGLRARLLLDLAV